ncbi:cullin family protein [Teladorsagia circumcincta]|uniref:Cullin family protein n=1 Tax=Teladorsagia circumcincta TaxID=45464 RepID=A0A2G9UND4_TELCI|nr:cullin family protein [Teladorsagia circumcincta]
MSDLSDEVMSDEESAEVYRQVFGEGEPEYMFEQLIDGPNVEQFDNEKERDDTNENMVDSRAARQISRGLPTVKKLTIKNFRRKNDDIADLMATGWLTLEASINAIQTKQHVATNLEQLYKVDRYLLRALLRMLRTLDLYKQTVDFLLHVERRIKEENERVDLYLDESTRTPLLTRAEKCLISDHMQEVVDNGLSLLLNDNRKVGKTMIMDPQRDPTMVEDLMTFKDKLDVFVETCFGSTEDKMKFAQAEKDAFDYFINTRGNKPAELIAKFMDARLRSANKEASDEQLDLLMSKVITLFRFIQGKDVFEVFYKKDLAKRLLLGRSASVDAEKIMLSKLRQECGAGFTQKLEGMFRDMELSKDLGVAFRNVSFLTT